MTFSQSVCMCCEKPKTQQLVIDGGNAPDLILQVCKIHVDEPCFNRFVVSN